MRNLIPLTDEEIEAKFDDCCTVEDLVFTRDTLDDFRSARGNYAEPGKVEKDTATVWELSHAQTAKGQPRRSIMVVDFGEVRAALEL
jgi:hypothetical protein